jgi:hypothetical protein
MRLIVSSAGQDSSAELRTPFTSTPGGVMTVEAGAITGELELITRPTADRNSIQALVSYAGARDLYTVAGSPVRAPSTEAHEDEHQRILKRLTTPGRVEEAGELPVELA